MNIEHLKNHVKKRRAELSAKYKTLEEDMDKLENLGRQDELLELLDWIEENVLER